MQLKYAYAILLFIVFTAVISCKESPLVAGGDIPQNNSTVDAPSFPPFYTLNEKFFNVTIGDVPVIDGKSYELNVFGAIDRPGKFSLAELNKLDLIDRTLTIECIGNSGNGNLVGNVVWKGFRLYDFLYSLGLNEDAVAVKFICKDGYYSTNSLKEIKENTIIGALYMNGVPIPTILGFPLKIINPGYYGVKNPGWVTDIEVLTQLTGDYWQGPGWKTDKRVEVNSKIFFPLSGSTFTTGETIKIGGCAYGCKHVGKVELSSTDGLLWTEAKIIKNLDEEYVWSFWESTLKFANPGNYRILARSADQDGNLQPSSDANPWDGTNLWPEVKITVK